MNDEWEALAGVVLVPVVFAITFLLTWVLL